MYFLRDSPATRHFAAMLLNTSGSCCWVLPVRSECIGSVSSHSETNISIYQTMTLQHAPLKVDWILIFILNLFLKTQMTRQSLTSQFVSSQPYFRSSRASAWGCDSEGASAPHPPLCLGSSHATDLLLMRRARASSVPAGLRESSFPDRCLLRHVSALD